MGSLGYRKGRAGDGGSMGNVRITGDTVERVSACPFIIDHTRSSGTVGSGILLMVDRLGCPLRASGDDSGP
jgi:hypothetical protein